MWKLLKKLARLLNLSRDEYLEPGVVMPNPNPINDLGGGFFQNLDGTIFRDYSDISQAPSFQQQYLGSYTTLNEASIQGGRDLLNQQIQEQRNITAQQHIYVPHDYSGYLPSSYGYANITLPTAWDASQRIIWDDGFGIPVNPRPGWSFTGGSMPQMKTKKKLNLPDWF